MRGCAKGNGIYLYGDIGAIGAIIGSGGRGAGKERRLEECRGAGALGAGALVLYVGVALYMGLDVGLG